MLHLAIALAALSFQDAKDQYPTTTPAAGERTWQPGVAARTQQRPQELPKIRLERINAGIPWPRGIACVDDQLVIVARGRHRNYGGPAQDYEDHGGTLYLVDPAISEPYAPGVVPSERIIANQTVLSEPDPKVVHVFDRSKAPIENKLMNRPYCTLVYDPLSHNVIFCAYSGVDTGEKPFFRKNATDAIYRYDLRSKSWGVIELHRDDVVPDDARSAVISNEYYPHHNPFWNSAPHGRLNGPNSCAVAGRYLYGVGKDNHTLARYELDEIRKDPNAGAPESIKVLGEQIDVRIEGRVQRIPMLGHSAVAANKEWLYLGARTSSIVVRFPLDEDGALVEPIVGELIAEFEPFDSISARSADLWDMALNSRGELFVSCAREGRVWKVIPDPKQVFDGDDKRKDPPSPNRPYLDGPELTGAKNARISNMTFDAQDRMLFCVTMTEAHTDRAGGIFRVIEER